MALYWHSSSPFFSLTILRKERTFTLRQTQGSPKTTCCFPKRESTLTDSNSPTVRRAAALPKSHLFHTSLRIASRQLHTALFRRAGTCSKMLASPPGVNPPCPRAQAIEWKITSQQRINVAGNHVKTTEDFVIRDWIVNKMWSQAEREPLDSASQHQPNRSSGRAPLINKSSLLLTISDAKDIWKVQKVTQNTFPTYCCWTQAKMSFLRVWNSLQGACQMAVPTARWCRKCASRSLEWETKTVKTETPGKAAHPETCQIRSPWNLKIFCFFWKKMWKF